MLPTTIFPRLINIFSATISSGCDSTKTFFGIPVWYKYLNVSGNGPNGSCDFSNFGFYKNGQFAPDNVFLILLALLDALLVIAGIVAVAFIIYGSIRLITSQGEPEGVKGARNTITNAIIGLVIALSASVLVNFIGTSLGSH